MSKIINYWKNADRYFLLPFLFSVFFCLLITLTCLILYSQLPSKIPLFYSLPWGEAQLVTKQQIFILPAVLLLVTLINSLLASQLHPVHFALKRILMFSLVCISLIILITTIKILTIFT